MIGRADGRFGDFVDDPEWNLCAVVLEAWAALNAGWSQERKCITERGNPPDKMGYHFKAPDCGNITPD